MTAWASVEVVKNESSGKFLQPRKCETPTRFRIMGDPLVGFSYWNNQRKPVRLREAPLTVPEDIGWNEKSKKQEQVSQFWAFCVWNYNEQRLQVLELTQTTIKDQIHRAFARPETLQPSDPWPWGDPTSYDFELHYNAKENDPSKRYTCRSLLNLSPKPAEAVAALQETPCNLEALFTNSDPFGGGSGGAPTHAAPYAAPPAPPLPPVIPAPVTPHPLTAMAAPTPAPVATDAQKLIGFFGKKLGWGRDRIVAIASLLNLPESSTVYTIEQAQELVTSMLHTNAVEQVGPENAEAVISVTYNFHPKLTLETADAAWTTYDSNLQVAKQPPAVASYAGADVLF